MELPGNIPSSVKDLKTQPPLYIDGYKIQLTTPSVSVTISNREQKSAFLDDAILLSLDELCI